MKTVGSNKAPLTIIETLEEEDAAQSRTQFVLQKMTDHQPFASHQLLFDGLVTRTKTGQAHVFRGTFKDSSNKVAIKMFLSRSPAEYEQEVAIMRAIPPHENVVTLLHAVDENPRRITVMPLLEGGSLENYYERTGVIPPAVIKQFLKQVASGMAHMHSCNIAHLDLKCGNVLIDSSPLTSNRALICDFGMATQIDGRAKAVYTGTPPFMATEVHAESEDCDLTEG